MSRYCFTLRVAPEHLEVYRQRHETVWPEMLEAIAASGRHDYSIFLGDDGLLVGVYETEDRDATDARLARNEVAARWEADMARLFGDGFEGRADQNARELREVFNLETQLAAARSRRPPTPCGPG